MNTDLSHDAPQASQEAVATRAHGEGGGCLQCRGPLPMRPKRDLRKFCSDACRSRHRHEAARRALARLRAADNASAQLPLPLPPPSRFLDVPAAPTFAGPGYDPGLDQQRLKRHCQVVLDFLRANPGWWTYEALGLATGVPVGSVRSRVSNLRAWGHGILRRTRPDRFLEVKLVEESRG
jgi:hypothetical protein